MDDAAKQNVLMFSGAISAIGAFWFLVLGAQQGSVGRVLGGIVAGAVSVACFTLYARTLKDAKRRRDES